MKLITGLRYRNYSFQNFIHLILGSNIYLLIFHYLDIKIPIIKRDNLKKYFKYYNLKFYKLNFEILIYEFRFNKKSNFLN